MEKLTIDEQQRFWRAVDQMEEAHEKIEKIYTLLAGDKSLHQEGIIERLVKVETQLEKMERDIDRAKGWLAGAVFVGGIVGSGLTLFVKFLIAKI
jgi:hypothetical protein